MSTTKPANSGATFQKDTRKRLLPGAALAVLLLAMIVSTSILLRSLMNNRWGWLIIILTAAVLGLLVLRNVKKVMLVILLIDIPIRWDIYLGARTTTPAFGMREGYVIAATTLALVVLYMVFITRELIRPGSQPRLLIWDNTPLLLYLFFTILSLTVAIDTQGALFQIFFLLQMLLVYLWIVSSTKTLNDLYLILAVLFIGLAFEGIIVLAQRFLGLTIYKLGIITVVSAGRYAGTLGSPNVAAGYFSLLLAPALSLLFSKISALARTGGLIAFCLGTIGLFFTASRGGLIAYVLSLIVLALLLTAQGKIAPWVAALLLMTSTITLALFGTTLIDKLVNVRLGAAQARLPLMQIAMKMIMDHPFLGVGANNYVLNFKHYLSPDFSQAYLYVVHNKYLLVWAETGIGGILAYLGFLGYSLMRGWKAWRVNHPILSPIALGFVAAITGQMAHMTVEIFDSRTQVQALWVVAAVVGAITNMLLRRKDG